MLFDYWISPADGDDPGTGVRQSPGGQNSDALPQFLHASRRDKPLVVFVSHHHKDHFSKAIYGFARHFSNVRYIVSDEVARMSHHVFWPRSIYRGPRVDESRLTVLSPGQVYDNGSLRIAAFGSTDAGNSYMVDVDGRRLFHAGDLNAWIWKDESSREEIDEALAAYGSILDDIRRATDRFDAVMFPVDSRIGTDYWTGASMFVRRFDVAVFFPMHFELGDTGDDRLRRERDACAFAAYANPAGGDYIGLQKPYSSAALH